MAERGTKEPLDDSERVESKSGLKLYIQTTKITANRWGKGSSSDRQLIY